MLTFRRALLAAVFIITIYYLTHLHKSPSSLHLDAANKPSEVHVLSDTQVISDRIMASSQQPLKEMSHASIRQKLAYQYPYDVEIRFPAYIWQTWRFTPASGEFKENYRPAEASWTELHPSFIHEVITDQVAIHLIRHLYASIPEILETYQALPLAVLKADFFRYLILFARGGIYSDIDTYAIKSATEWLPESVPKKSIGLIIGIESDPDIKDTASQSSRPILFCQWTIQSKPGHPALLEVIAKITENVSEKIKNGSIPVFDINNVQEFTGSILWTDVIFKYFNDPRYFDLGLSRENISGNDFTGMKTPKKVGDVAILPITSFSPGINQMGSEGFDSPMAYVRHEFAGTWKPEPSQSNIM